MLYIKVWTTELHLSGTLAMNPAELTYPIEYGLRESQLDTWAKQESKGGTTREDLRIFYSNAGVRTESHDSCLLQYLLAKLAAYCLYTT